MKTVKKCPNCNKNFESNDYDNREFCSRKCDGIWRSKNMVGEKSTNWKGGMIIKKCEFCHKKFKFPPYRKDAKFCSVKCYHKSICNMIIRSCQFCNKKFKFYKSSLKKFCLRKCYENFVDSEKNIVQCKFCKRKFHPDYKGKLFCSAKCREKFEEQNHIIKKCEFCDKEFESLKSASRKFCCAKCFSNSIIGRISPMKGKKHSLETKRRLRLRNIQRKKEQNGPLYPFYNKSACIFFNEINKKYNLCGLHAEYVGEVRIKELGYWVDYYDPYLNLVIEWNEKHHYDVNGKLKPKDLVRQKEIEDFLKCEFIHIRQKNFEQEKEFVLKRIETIIKNKYQLKSITEIQSSY